jgi:hypothetical protein
MAAATPDIDALFQLPPGEFTAARNALAATLKAAGRAEDAAAIKALPKPPLSAWTVNQLYWRHRNAFDQLIATGDRLRKAQASQLAGKGGEMRPPLEARRAALAELTKGAAALLRDAGHGPTPDLTRRITTTLEALATYGSESSAPPAGRLTRDVDPPGFDALASLVPGKRGRARGTGPSRVIPFRPQTKRSHPKMLDAAGKKRQRQEERKAQRAAAAAAVRNAERTLRNSRKAAARAESALRKAAARAKVTEKKKAALEKRFEKATADADGARQDARRVASAAEEAAQAVADAERTLDQARRAHKSLTD